MRHKVIGNVPTSHISNLEASAYLRARASYNYPKAYIVATNNGSHHIQLSPTLFGSFIIPAAGVITDMWLDQYHYQLLRSPSADDRLLGLVSVVYWGYFTFGAAYAQNRVGWLVNGYRKMPATTSSLAFAHTTAAMNYLAQKNVGQAMAALSGISQLNQTPFASKVIAFMAPSIAGVYDKKIGDGLASESWATNMAHGVGQSSSAQVKLRYQSWCIYLSQLASQLNLGISFGKKWEWSCGNDKNQLWRALDVERALFASFGMQAAQDGGVA